MLRLFNSLTRQLEDFKPIKDNQVGFYACGPTVYDYPHLGNMRTMILNDILRRVLEYDGYKVNFVMNITDVGHLTSDADTGEDKMEKNAKTKQDVMAIAQTYTDAFLADVDALNIKRPSSMPKASEHIADQIELIKILIAKGAAYESNEAVYFDVSKFANYTKLTGQKPDEMMLGARQEVVKDEKKKNPMDFVLWFKAVGRYKNHILKWDSPWGEGFPGWHIECSAMSAKYLGQPFDLHTGGVDLKFPHHTNEIAQSESAMDKPFVNYWVHAEHLLVDDEKMSKSDGNFLTLKNLTDRKFNPLAYRYLVLTSHYRSRLNFTQESLQASENALRNIYTEVSGFEPNGNIIGDFESKFKNAVNDDLDTPKAIAVTWDMLRSAHSGADKLATLLRFDEVLGLRISEIFADSNMVPESVQNLIDEREEARKAKDFDKSDQLRQAIESAGFLIEDTAAGARVKKKF